MFHSWRKDSLESLVLIAAALAQNSPFSHSEAVLSSTFHTYFPQVSLSMKWIREPQWLKRLFVQDEIPSPQGHVVVIAP